MVVVSSSEMATATG